MSLDIRTAARRSTDVPEAPETSESPETPDTVDQVTDRVLAKHPELAAESVRARVAEAHGQYAGSRIRDFVPVLVEREVLDDLRDHTTSR